MTRSLARVAIEATRASAGWTWRCAADAAAVTRWCAAEARSSLASAVARSALLDRVVDIQLRRAAPAALEQVLEQLEREPERVRALIRGQREDIVDDVVTRLRSGAVAGDAAADRLLHRRRPP